MGTAGLSYPTIMFKHTLLFLSTILASSLAEDPGTDRMKVTLCGNQLVGMLNIICSLNFDSPSVMFHSNFDDFLMSLAQRKKRSLSEEPEDYYRDYNRRFLGKRGGLAMACCNNPCSMQDLRGFC